MRSGEAGIRFAAALVAGAALAIVTLASPAAAFGLNFTVQVDVAGPVPAGTIFTVHWSCPSNNVGNQSGDFHFTSTGTPIGGNSVVVSSVGSCSATETPPGGVATVTSTCSVSNGNAVCTDDHTVQWQNLANFPDGTITFTNGFLPGLTVAPPSAAVGQPFTVSSAACTKALFGGSATTGGSVQATAGFVPPIVMSTTAAGTTGAWSVTFTVPANAPSGPIAVNATCNDPAAYNPASFTVVAAATPIVANPVFTG